MTIRNEKAILNSLKAEGSPIGGWSETTDESESTYELLSDDKRMPKAVARCVAEVAKDVIDILGKPPHKLVALVSGAEERLDHSPLVLVGLGLLKGVSLALQMPVGEMLTMAGVIPITLGKYKYERSEEEDAETETAMNSVQH